MNKKLFIDPSGTGTTGICIVGSEITFLKCENKDWKEHFKKILELVKEYSFDTVVYEINNYVGPVNRGRDIINLLKLFAAIDTLAYYFPGLKVNTVSAKQTQQMKEQIRNKEKGIAGLNYQRGKAWTYQDKNISVHEVDAFLVYWIWKGNNYDTNK
ncbi:conserved protein of unknown function [endosymbiont DhMRE of Dentiscutata heterogama]|uniref:hypothetical protein n=1 Tax=endosymbiont DhMRE of Dentiscutata heterogama TaxID=1609546 RepID=UPI000629D94F|nr:hypothetical protein [endosymbiont DhMRE of Dentiscutata heterogama]CFW92992.1 conserved protein of unknown function [endosymbiont DhMRE of Dentiscutata heterogama]